MSKKHAERSRSNGNYTTGTVEIDVELLMQEIDERAERQRPSLPTGSAGAAKEQTTHADRTASRLERRLHEALDAQVALNASILDSLARLDHAYREAQCLQTALSQKLELHERVQLQLTNEVAGLREEVGRLEETTERLRRSTLGLVHFVRETREPVAGEPHRLEARVEALEQTVRMLVSRHQKTDGQHE